MAAPAATEPAAVNAPSDTIKKPEHQP